jgi:hypothetical protein
MAEIRSTVKDMTKDFVLLEGQTLVGTGNRVMVSCWEGDNRSSLVSVLALRYLTHCKPKEASS